MAASHASSSGDRQRRSRRIRGGGEDQQRPKGAPNDAPATPFDEEMTRPEPRPEPTERENVMCVKALAPRQEQPPFHTRRGLATIRPRQVDTHGAARLFCDCLHDGPHQWPHVYEPLIPPAEDADLPGDGSDEVEVLTE